MTNNNKAPASFYLLLVLVLFQGLSGLYGGIMLVLDPSGSLLQIPLNLLAESPFHDYMVPGIILLVLLGIFPLVTGFGLWQKHPRAGNGAFLTGIILVIWIAVQIAMVGYQAKPPLQAIYGSVGVLILITVSVPPVRQYLRST
ncbi:MAG TPA: hypothetical protein VJ905_05020 [Halalkalibaculum sp.]|nr:hypothetical protein [Halalkalibaculum sp.]